MEQSKGIKIVFLMCLGIFLCMIDTTIMNIALPAIQSSVNTSLEKMSWVLNVYTMTIAVLAIPLGRIADIFGKAKVYILGLIIFGGGSVLCAFANTGDFLIFSRFIQSVGAAILFPTSMVIGVSAMPLAKRHVALAILGVTQGLSAALGPVIGGIITQNVGWRWVFFVNVPICILGIILCCIMLQVKNEERIISKIDWIGLILSSLAIFSFTLVLVKGNTWGWQSNIAWSCYAISTISLILFVLVERKIHNPMVNLKLFKDRMFVGASIVVILSNLFLIGVTVLLPTFLTKIQYRTEIEAAFLVTPISAMIFFVSPVAATLIKKFGKVTIILSGFLVMGLSYYWLQMIDVNSTNIEIIIPCMILGVGYGLVVGPITVLSASSFEGELLTASQTVVSMLRQVGIVLAVAIFVSNLTHNLSVNKENVYRYAEEKVRNIHVDSAQQAEILQVTKEKIEKQSIETNVEKKQNETLVGLSKEKKDELIHQKVDEVLSGVPVEYREIKREEVTNRVTKEVEKQEESIKKEVLVFSKDVSQYAKNKMAMSFTDLYKASVPVILICALVSLLFWEGRLRISRRKKKLVEEL
ncbi:DHA2 family efflux MFS transporter permease subunit [Bacillus mycoides]|uniref:MFS transporter n=1 Tax=Bacillus TaxID=1386 RepID=UPI000993D0F9|nr:MFS transporter [Bacillus mycoides]MDR4901218.1 DHA2 family efflux MFS transporter permease subunit [Bacillus mycoides]MED1010621.1 DHA2 family efflux MFS transporter permease subunit [Bacillus mycoides]MED1043927.1 DHA2 family efflux MFS transporter permease subunit [Bacillus mycoides]MED1050158.1 DHA2 family efflux MFS transporter permease subunit [Bacillus mycoides]MED1084169.1 DHA2 family efflux MFS transporter permease subunit [Bacillus mycoides]